MTSIKEDTIKGEEEITTSMGKIRTESVEETQNLSKKTSEVANQPQVRAEMTSSQRSLSKIEPVVQEQRPQEERAT